MTRLDKAKTPPTHWHQQNINVYPNRLFFLPPSPCNVAIKEFVLVALHTEPWQAVQELNRLYDVFEEVKKKWNNMVKLHGNMMTTVQKMQMCCFFSYF